MLADQDTRDSMHQGMRQEMTQLAAAFNSEAAFIEPEILRADQATLGTFIAADPRLRGVPDSTSRTSCGGRRTR